MKATEYDYDIVKSYVNWSIIWGVVAVLVGVIVSLQMVDPRLNFPPYLTFGRLRPIHTNAGIYGWVVGAIFATFLYMVQRLCKTPLWSPKLARFQLWFFNITIIASAVTLLMGFTTSKEYHEMEWPIDVMVVILWVVYRSSTRDRLQQVALGLVFGGALGNFHDRIRYQEVVDFLDVGIGTHRWPTFNMADSGVTVGVTVLVVWLMLSERRREKETTEHVDSSEARAADGSS